MSDIEYKIEIKDGKFVVDMSKKDLARLFNGSYEEFCKVIDKMGEDAKNIYFRGGAE